MSLLDHAVRMDFAELPKLDRGVVRSWLAKQLPSVLSEPDDDAALEVTALHSITGLLPPGGWLLRRPVPGAHPSGQPAKRLMFPQH
ncbi:MULTISPECIES: ATP-binding protein [Micromonospora]|uniref:ATP-binding protein n=1 Tax=Micromonospora TaxID=1873 RepID=UPI001FC9C589|nr:ATP-binding protein [Micromonospora tulbaghiae]